MDTKQLWRVRKWVASNISGTKSIEVVGKAMDVPELISWVRWHGYPVVSKLPPYYSPECVEIMSTTGDTPSDKLLTTLGCGVAPVTVGSLRPLLMGDTLDAADFVSKNQYTNQ